MGLFSPCLISMRVEASRGDGESPIPGFLPCRLSEGFTPAVLPVIVCVRRGLRSGGATPPFPTTFVAASGHILARENGLGGIV